MAMLDSKAVFHTRALELGINEAELKVLKDKKWDSFGKIAFASSYQPGNPDETALLKLAAVITGSGADEPDEERLPIIRRLYFEAFTMASADFRSRIEQRDEDVPRKLARPERTQRD